MATSRYHRRHHHVPSDQEEEEEDELSTVLNKTSNQQNEEGSDIDIVGDEDELAPNDRPQSLNYFLCHNTRVKTSSSTLADYELPSGAEIGHTLSVLQDHTEEKKRLLKRIELEDFQEWYDALEGDFNILVYGYGSKKQMLNLFCKKYLNTHHYFVIHGFFTEINLKNIIQRLCSAISPQHSNGDEAKLFSLIENLPHKLFLVIHSLDVLLSFGPSSQKLKDFLYRLAQKFPRTIRIVASVDHVNSAFLWDSHELPIFNWLWFHAPTYQTYTVERGHSTAFTTKMGFSMDSALHQLTLSSVDHVYASLTPRAQQIFELILKFYVDQEEELGQKPASSRTRASTYDPEDSDEDDNEPRPSRSNMNARKVKQALPLSQLYRECSEKFIVTSQLTLKAHLVEFIDHKLIKLYKATDGSQVIDILIPLTIAKKFLEKLNN